MKYFLPFLILFCSLVGISQPRSISRYELFWAISHPLAALKVQQLIQKCDQMNDSNFVFKHLDRNINGGKADAFRHVFYMATFAQKIKGKKLRKLGIARERKNHRDFLHAKKEFGEYADSLSCVMDLYNNAVGITLGRKYKHIALEELRKLVIAEINMGKSLIMKRNKNGNYLTCAGELLNLENNKGKWSVPKCLVFSNYRFDD